MCTQLSQNISYTGPKKNRLNNISCLQARLLRSENPHNGPDVCACLKDTLCTAARPDLLTVDTTCII